MSESMPESKSQNEVVLERRRRCCCGAFDFELEFACFSKSNKIIIFNSMKKSVHLYVNIYLDFHQSSTILQFRQPGIQQADCCFHSDPFVGAFHVTNICLGRIAIILVLVTIVHPCDVPLTIAGCRQHFLANWTSSVA